MSNLHGFGVYELSTEEINTTTGGIIEGVLGIAVGYLLCSKFEHMEVNLSGLKAFYKKAINRIKTFELP